MTRLKGIFPALITPFTRNGRVNEQALRQIVRMNIKKGVNGFYVGGSTAEAFLLSLEERRLILDVVLDETKRSVPIIAHVGCISTDQTVELARHAREAGVDAISAITPFYYDFTASEVLQHYQRLMDSVDLPVIVYYFPALSGVNLSASELRDLLSRERVVGIKHTSYNLFQLERLKRAKSGLLVYNGHDEIFLAGLAMGADGAIGSTYNFMAEKFLAIRRYFNDHRYEEARRLQGEANEIIELLIRVGVIPGTKVVLKMMGIDCGVCREPFRQLTPEEENLLRQAVQKYLAV